MKQIKYFIFILLIALFTACNPNQSDKRSKTDNELIEALSYHHEFKVSVLIEDLRRLDKIDKLIPTERASAGTNKWTPLCFASFFGNRNAVLKLIQNGANINFRDGNGQTPIILAAITGNREEINVLLKNGANINDTDNNGSTPLIHAATQGNIQTVQFLVESGCLLKPKKGQSALDFALFHQQDEVINYLKKIELKN